MNILIKMGFNESLKNEILLNINRFVSEDKRKNKRYIRHLVWDILYAKYRNLIDVHEYFCYRFDTLNDVGRKEYFGRVRQTLSWAKFETENTYRIFLRKMETYHHFLPYFKREVIEIKEEKDRKTFFDFVSKHKHIVIKPVDGIQGKGVKVIYVKSEEEKEKTFSEIISVGSCIVEEFIQQVSQMAAFHPQSLNTIRYVTFYHQGKLHKICAVIRMGRNNNCVDNACAGGIYAPIDLERGVVWDYGRTHMMEEYLFHPDTGVQILGAHIPKWDELNKIIEEVVKVVPEQKQVGWDFALTEKGWVIVEANYNPGIQRLIHRHGLICECDAIYKAYKEI